MQEEIYRAVAYDHRPLVDYVVGVDVGRKRDPSAICVLSEPVWLFKEGRWAGIEEFDARKAASIRSKTHANVEYFRPPDVPLVVNYLQRLPLGTKYEALVNRVLEIVSKPPLTGRSGFIALDASGVGDSVRETMQRNGLRPASLIITGGQNASNPEPGVYHLPHVKLIGAIDLAVDQGRLKLPANMPNRDKFLKELETFEAHRSDTGYLTYEQIRNSKTHHHGDQVIAAALAVWYRNIRNGRYDKVAAKCEAIRDARGYVPEPGIDPPFSQPVQVARSRPTMQEQILERVRRNNALLGQSNW